MRVNKIALLLVGGLLAGAGCTSTGSPSADPSSPAAPAGFGPAAQSCPETAASQPTTRQGTGRGVEMWALLFPRRAELAAGDELKIVMRVTGPQDTVITATGPAGQSIKPVWGPEYHGDSTFDHPGAEFGAGWVFPVPGCWQLHLVNSAGSADLTLRLGPPLTPSPSP